jgi:hypothetical protein
MSQSAKRRRQAAHQARRAAARQMRKLEGRTMKFDTTEPVRDYKGREIPANDSLSKTFGLRLVMLGEDGKPTAYDDTTPLTLGDLLWEAMQMPDPAQQQQGQTMDIVEKRFCHKMSQQALSGATIEIDVSDKEKIVDRAGNVLPTATFGMLDDAFTKAANREANEAEQSAAAAAGGDGDDPHRDEA